MRSADFDLAAEDRQAHRATWQRGAEIVDALPRRSELVAALRPAVDSWLATSLPSKVAINGATLPADEELRAAVGAILRRRNCDAHTDTQSAAWLLLADAVSESLVANPPARQSLERIHDNSRAPWEFSSRVERRLVELLRADSGQRETWIGFLETTAPEFLDELADDIGPAVRDRAARWQSQTDPFAVFDAEYLRGGLGWHRTVAWTVVRFRFLLALSPERFLTALDALPLPHLMWSTVQLLHVHEDPDLVLALIRIAPQIWDDKGAWTRSTALFIVTDLVLDYVRAVRDAVKNAAEFPFMPQNPAIEERKARAAVRLRELQDAELERWATRAASTALERADGLRVLLHQSARYARIMTIGESGRRRGDWSPTDKTLGAITSALASATVAPSRFRDEWFAREQARRRDPPTSEGAVVIVTEGLPHLIAAIHVLDRRINQAPNCSDDERAREVCRLWDWLSELVTGRDPGIDLIRVNGAEFALQLVGYLLAAQPWPPDQWKAVYRALEAHRRRVSTRNRDDDFLPARTSADFIWVGLYGCSSWRNVSGEPAVGAREFLFEIIECSRALLLLDGGIDLVGRAAREAFTTCFAGATRVLGPTVIEDVVAMLEPIVNDPGLLRDIFNVLRANGVDDAAMAAICTRLDVDEATAIAFGNRIFPPPPAAS